MILKNGRIEYTDMQGMLSGIKRHALRGVAALLVCLSVSILSISASGQEEMQGKMYNPHGSLSLNCLNCHTSTSWSPIRPAPDFDHQETGYPLRGLHKDADCSFCHASLLFADVGKECSDCHADIHRGEQGSDCEQCHTVMGWNERLKAPKNHNEKFPLTGAHSTVACATCHKLGSKLNANCVTCHEENYRATQRPNHQVVNLPQSCEGCHEPEGWHNARFDHNLYVGFELTGTHASQKCSACHTGGNFSNQKSECVACHEKDFSGTESPDHVEAGFAKDCRICHTSSTWYENTFSHETATGFSLSGIHATLPCDICHKDGKFIELAQGCYQCHSGDFASTVNPNHAKSRFSNNCTQCHTSNGWDLVEASQVVEVFDHSTTGFALTGKPNIADLCKLPSG